MSHAARPVGPGPQAGEPRYYLYGFCLPTARPPEVPGVGGAVVGGLDHLGVRTVCTPWSGPAPGLTRELALIHARIVESATYRGPFLACAAGTVMDEQRLLAWLADNQSRLLHGLDRVAGQVELILKLWARETVDVPTGERRRGGPPSDQRWSAAAVALVAEAQSAAASFLEAVQEQLTDVQVVASPKLLYQAEMMVPRPALGPLRQAFEALRQSLPAELVALLSGPWPPFHFSGVRIDEASDG